jgi:flavin reductase (DIM6/NTAB) family NADH-FMN oxidoreductase RutF
VTRREIEPTRLRLLAVGAWKERKLLLAAGDYGAGAFNFMTVGWGGIGYFWKRPLAMIMVRPSRYTYEFMESHPDFTLNLFPEEYAEKVAWCGSHSGRTEDKVKHTGLTPTSGRRVAAPVFAEAELVLECRKVYWSELEPARFLADFIQENYPAGDYHRLYFGEILAAAGTAAYQG